MVMARGYYPVPGGAYLYRRGLIMQFSNDNRILRAHVSDLLSGEGILFAFQLSSDGSSRLFDSFRGNARAPEIPQRTTGAPQLIEHPAVVASSTYSPRCQLWTCYTILSALL
jgi:hypothetical protein